MRSATRAAGGCEITRRELGRVALAAWLSGGNLEDPASASSAAPDLAEGARWANDDAEKLTQGLRAALDRTNVKHGT